METKKEDKKTAYCCKKMDFITGFLAGVSFMSVIFIMMLMIVLASFATKEILVGDKPDGNNAVGNNEANKVDENNKGTDTAVPSPVSIDTSKDYVRGAKNAAIMLVEYSDFECPFCKKHFPTMNQLLKEYEGKIGFVYKHYPLPFHKNAQKAAEATECSGEQGKFWEMHDKLFEGDDLSVENIKKLAKNLKLNTSQFNKCLDDGKYEQKVKDQTQEATKFGVTGTPATFVNGYKISGAHPVSLFKEVIDAILAGKDPATIESYKKLFVK